jgi:hypothetical protein
MKWWGQNSFACLVWMACPERDVVWVSTLTISWQKKLLMHCPHFCLNSCKMLLVILFCEWESNHKPQNLQTGSSFNHRSTSIPFHVTNSFWLYICVIFAYIAELTVIFFSCLQIYNIVPTSYIICLLLVGWIVLWYYSYLIALNFEFLLYLL